MPLAPLQPATKLICGCGYLGERVARRWLAEGHKVFATTRSVSRAAQLSRMGIQPLIADISRPLRQDEITGVLPSITTALFAVGFDRTPGQSIRDVYVGGLSNFIEALTASVDRFIYISSTGVYGDTDGEWVNEETLCQPVTPGGQACLAAEQLLRASHLASRSVILRLAGIYGPDRIPKLAAVRAGKPIESAESGFLNLIYVDDAVETVLAAERVDQPPPLVTVSDGNPVVRRDFYFELARLLNAPEPRFVAPREGTSKAGRAASDKRVANRRMREVLQVEVRYPTYREGLAAIVSELT